MTKNNVSNLNKDKKTTATVPSAQKAESRQEADTSPGILSQFKQSEKTTKKKTTAVAVTTKVENSTLQNMIAAQLTDRKFAPVSADELVKNVTYVTAGNGVFKVVKTPVALFKVKIADTAGVIPGLPEMEEGVELLIPKIPFRKIIQALTYYIDINAKDRTEASVLFFWNTNNLPLPEVPGLTEEGQLVTYCPVQKNSGALSNFTMDTTVPWLRENMSLLLETHSHNTMSAFFSGTDNANENMTQFYGVWGHVTKEEPAFIFRWVCGDRKVVCSPDVLIDWPVARFHEEVRTVRTKSLHLEGDISLVDIEGSSITRTDEETPIVNERIELVKGPFKRVEYPLDWMGQHSTSYNYPKSGGYTRYGTGRNVSDYYDYDIYGGRWYDAWGDYRYSGVEQGVLFDSEVSQEEAEAEMDVWMDERVPQYPHERMANRRVEKAGGVHSKIIRTKKTQKPRRHKK